MPHKSVRMEPMRRIKDQREDMRWDIRIRLGQEYQDGNLLNQIRVLLLANGVQKSNETPDKNRLNPALKSWILLPQI